MIDIEDLPKEVIDIVDSFNIDGCVYDEATRIKKELYNLSWLCDFDLSGTLYDFRYTGK